MPKLPMGCSFALCLNSSWAATPRFLNSSRKSYMAIVPTLLMWVDGRQSPSSLYSSSVSGGLMALVVTRNRQSFSALRTWRISSLDCKASA